MREDHGVTQQQLSILAGCSKNYLSAVERGVNKLTVPVLLEYCNALKVTPNDILGFESSDLNDELQEVISRMSKDERERAASILKLL